MDLGSAAPKTEGGQFDDREHRHDTTQWGPSRDRRGMTRERS